MPSPLQKIIQQHHLISLGTGMIAALGSFGSFFVTFDGMAQDTMQRPLFMPTRDATVVYAVQPENSPLVQTRKIYFSGNGNTLRIDGPNHIGMTIVDSAKKTAIVIANKSKVYTVIPSKSGQSGLFLDDNMKFVKKGSDRVAGILCDRWKVTGSKGKSDVCITKDGVLLQQEGVDADGQEGKTVAISVDYNALPASTFQVPVGYQQIKLPERKGDVPALVTPNSNGQPLSPIKAQPLDPSKGVKVNANENPFITPQRDVDVVYAIAAAMPGLPPFHQRMRWSVGEWKQRIDSQGVDTYMITDYRKRELVVLNPELRKKTTMPAPGDAILAPGQKPSGDYIKVGEATVAGQHCNEWQIVDSEGNPNDICYTDDGVMLRVVRNNIPLVVALKVAYAPQDSKLFNVPTNLKELAPAHP
ncbi:DUF4412 domain-containing protein [Commensalibacter oyaizuii]|uniref:DUF4412 domain-containing protein n=1 Tax=Commensalibacter oyaizuii TaxID=3043873 RepID=A0ABT6Q148_9PROT|nr:DUF4412 domain-containing protein [Commensalibacter sp. TBRC 16381]MDI2090708.1 DUF4412 domain-containing protein [Commensalibacter sp. TBRC 16381]